uniref:Uncharacterized protein n=1 Tax=Arundo donax TaxID=35708 RepID=A0A0A9HFP1_ARUDO
MKSSKSFLHHPACTFSFTFFQDEQQFVRMGRRGWPRRNGSQWQRMLMHPGRP